MKIYSTLLFVFIISLTLAGFGCKKTTLLTQEEKDTELFKAIENGDFKKTQDILDIGANPNSIEQFYAKTLNGEITKIDNHYDTPLGNAVYKKRLEIARLLLERGADVNTRFFTLDFGTNNKSIHTNFSQAVSNQDVQMMRLLLEHRPNLDNDRNSFLVMTSARSKEVLNLLIENGFDINSADGYGVNVLMEAIEANHKPDLTAEELDYVIAILAHHPNLDAVSAPIRFYGETELTALKLAKMYKRTEVIKELKKAGAKN